MKGIRTREAAEIREAVRRLQRFEHALKAIVQAEPGSRGAYRKFVGCQLMAKQALEGSTDSPKGEDS